MTSIRDLENLNKEHKTVKEWVESFDGEERELIEWAFQNFPPARVYNIIANFDENPFPFSQSTLATYMRKVKK